jgi:hypothetical protein
MDDLVAFLRARLDEDERVAQAAPPGPWAEDASHSVVDATGARVIYSVNGGTLHPTHAVRAHVLGNDPARVLREVAAKREILEQHVPVGGGMVCLSYCHTRTPGEEQAWPCLTMRLLVLPYAGHPDYRDGWTPRQVYRAGRPGVIDSRSE